MSRPPAVPHVVALGGGGFSTLGHLSRVDRYVLALAGVSKPKVAFLATASGDAPAYIERFVAAFGHAGAQPTAVSLAAEDVAATRRLLLEQDVVYVGGGDPQLLLDRWRQHDVEATLAEAHRRGVVLAGTSAGAMCWFEHVVDEERDEVVPGLRLLPGAFVPHASTAPRHVAVATRALERGQLGVAWFVDEWAALHFVGRDLARVIADPGDAGVAEVRPTAGGVETRRLAATTLDGTT